MLAARFHVRAAGRRAPRPRRDKSIVPMPGATTSRHLATRAVNGGPEKCRFARHPHVGVRPSYWFVKSLRTTSEASGNAFGGVTDRQTAAQVSLRVIFPECWTGRLHGALRETPARRRVGSHGVTAAMLVARFHWERGEVVPYAIRRAGRRAQRPAASSSPRDRTITNNPRRVDPRCMCRGLTPTRREVAERVFPPRGHGKRASSIVAVAPII